MRKGAIPFFHVAILLWAATAAAQEVPFVRNFSPAVYGGQNQNWSLAQSPAGWLVVGNNGGLLEFDGATWRRLGGQNTVRAVATGPKGELFCGGFAEFGFWETRPDGRWAYHSLSQQLPSEQFQKEEVWHIFFAQNSVYFQSFSRFYRYENGKVSVVPPPASVMFATVASDKIWVPVIGKGLYLLLPDGTFEFVPKTEALSDKIVQFIVPNASGGVWAGTTSHGIFEVGNGQCQPWSSPLNEQFKKHQLNKAVRLRNGGCAVGTILGGLYLLDERDELLFRLDRSNGLQNNTVLALLEDRDGNLWAGLDRGLDFVQLRSPLTYFRDQTGKIGTVYSAVQWRGYLYLGTNQGVFRKPLNTAAPFQLVEGSQGQVWQLSIFDGQLLCGHNVGTFIIEDAQARKISDVTGGWCTIAVPDHPDLLLQSTYTGLIFFQKNKAGKWTFSHRVVGFSEPLRRIAFGPDGTLWGTHPNQGLYALLLSTDWQKCTESRLFTRKDSLPADTYLDLTNIGGQLYLNTETWPLKPSRQTDGQWQFESVEHNGTDRFKWLKGRGSDFFRLDSSGISLHSAGRTYKMALQLVPRFEQVEDLPDSSYLFCLDNGYALLDYRHLAHLDEQPDPPAPVIRYVKAGDGEPVTPVGEMTFSFAQNSLRFAFGQAVFERQPQYTWLLEGFSKNWSDWQTFPEKEFTNLPEGHYTFRLKSDAGGGEASFSFKVLPPWYRSIWAYLAYALALGLALWHFEQFNRRRLERQRQRLQAEKEREILLLEVENKSRELSNAAFNLIRKNEALQHLRDELLDGAPEVKNLQKIVRQIDLHLEGDHDWEIFEESFNRVHDDFFKRLMQRFPDLTPGDLRLAAYLKMNLSSKEIAPLLNISVRGIENKRYRLRKKIGLSEEDNLTEFIMNF